MFKVGDKVLLVNQERGWDHPIGPYTVVKNRGEVIEISPIPHNVLDPSFFVWRFVPAYTLYRILYSDDP